MSGSRSWLVDNRHLVTAGIWAVLAVPTLLFWKESILWVAFMSLYANFASEVAAHQAKKTRKEVNGD